jgi:hypothetical protein
MEKAGVDKNFGWKNGWVRVLGNGHVEIPTTATARSLDESLKLADDLADGEQIIFDIVDENGKVLRSGKGNRAAVAKAFSDHPTPDIPSPSSKISPNNAEPGANPVDVSRGAKKAKEPWEMTREEFGGVGQPTEENFGDLAILCQCLQIGQSQLRAAFEMSAEVTASARRKLLKARLVLAELLPC